MWYAERKQPVDISHVDNLEYQDWINQRSQEILEVNPGMDPIEVRVREIISRYRGENGLSRQKVDTITAHIMHLIKSM